MKTAQLDVLRIVGLLLLSGLLLASSYSLHPLWWAAWIAPAPAIAATSLAPDALRRKLGLLTGIIAGVSTFSYHLTVAGWPAAISILCLVAIAWAGTFRLAVASLERWSALPAVLVVPTTWAAIDTLLIHVSPHGSAGSIAYSQMDFLPAIQIASLGGVPAVTFIVLLAGSYAGLVLARMLGTPARGLRVAGFLVAVVVGCSLLFGAKRLSAVRPAGGINVAMLASDGMREQPRNWRAFQDAYGPAIGRATVPGTVVLLPEAVARLDSVEAEQIAVQLASFARARAATIVAGVVVTEGARITNRALVARADGQHAWYVKQHLVPGFEAGMTPGSRPLLLRTPIFDTGVAICKDMHFPTLGRVYALAGARLMLVPAFDFDVDDWMTARMTVLRGVEGGYPIARSARQGLSVVSDPYGRILAEHRSKQGMSILTAKVPNDFVGPTIYSVLGDAFGWLCVIGWAGLLFARQVKPGMRVSAAPTQAALSRKC